MTVIPQNNKCCANCAYWCGEREKDSFVGRFEVENINKSGKCSNKCGFFNAETHPFSTCHSFEKHPIVKNF